MAWCIVFSQSSVPSRNSEPDEADELDEPDEADEAETVSATAAPTPLSSRRGQGLRQFQNKIPQINFLILNHVTPSYVNVVC